MPNNFDGACNDPEISSLLRLAENNKQAEFSAKLTDDMNSQAPEAQLKFLRQLQQCFNSERPTHPNLPNLEITHDAAPKDTKSI